MTKIRRLRVAGFRGARFDLPVDLTKEHRSIAFYGENASGKSTLTDALEWFINNRVQHLWREGCKQDALRHVLCDDDEPSQPGLSTGCASVAMLPCCSGERSSSFQLAILSVKIGMSIPCMFGAVGRDFVKCGYDQLMSAIHPRLE